MNTIKLKHVFLTFTCIVSLCFSNETKYYKFRESIDKDSLFKASISQMIDEDRNELIKAYNDADEKSRDFILTMISMPKSSKNELVQNIKRRRNEIDLLIQEYSKLVPDGYIVDIEYEAASPILTIPDQFDIRIYSKVGRDDSDGKSLHDKKLNKGTGLVYRRLEFGSKDLNNALLKLDWTEITLKRIIELLQNANCISIENGQITTVGFARSGMGKYSFKIFEKQLINTIDNEYNDGCTFIKYDENIVLEFQGGAIGQQCFETINPVAPNKR